MEARKMENISPQSGDRDLNQDNQFGLEGLDHVAVPTRNLPLMECFIREVLGGAPYYYAGFDETDRQLGRRPHVFIRVGNILFQCTEEPDSVMNTKDDPNIAPHIAFKATPDNFERNFERLSKILPVAGPFRHRNSDVVTFYFQSPEGHKLEICTWGRYEGDKAKMIARGDLNWPALAHEWPQSSPNSRRADS